MAMPSLRAESLEDLDVHAATGLLALLRSRTSRRPVCPTKAMTVHLLNELHQRSIVEVPWPATRWELPPRGLITPVEELAWDFAWKEVELDGLEIAIDELLDYYTEDPEFIEQRVRVWRELIQADCVDYFEDQLTKHGFDPAWSIELKWLPPHYTDVLSLARWRYLIWSSVRQGAMESLRSRSDPKQTREAIANTLASPARLGYAMKGTFDGFLPKILQPYSLMGQAYTAHSSRIGVLYWTEPPRVEVLSRTNWDCF